MRESEIERKFVDEVRRAGGRAYKFTSPGNDGVPDRLVIFPGGRIVFAELKTDKGRLSPIQERQIKKLMELGATVEVVRGEEGVDEFKRKYFQTS